MRHPVQFEGIQYEVELHEEEQPGVIQGSCGHAIRMPYTKITPTRVFLRDGREVLQSDPQWARVAEKAKQERHALVNFPGISGAGGMLCDRCIGG